MIFCNINRTPEENPGKSKSGDINSKTKKPVTWRIIRNVLPWAVTALILIYVFKQVPLSDVREAFALVRLHIFIPVSLFVFTIFFLADSLTHHLAFNWLAAHTKFLEVLPARGATYLLTQLNFFAGQGGIGYWLSRKKKVPAGEAASTIVFVMFMDFFVIMFLSSIGILLMPEIHPGHFFNITSKGSLVRVVYISLAVILFMVFIWVDKPEGKLVRWLMFRGPFMVFDRLKFSHFAWMFLFKLIRYIVEIIGAWVGLKAFGVNVPLFKVFTYLPLIYLISAIPITVLNLGTSQVAWLFFFEGAASPGVLIAFSFLWHFSFVVAKMTVGVTCLPSVTKDLSSDPSRPRRD